MNACFMNNTPNISLNASGSQPDMMSLLMSLQQTINQQSMLLQLLLKQQMMQQNNSQEETNTTMMQPENIPKDCFQQDFAPYPLEKVEIANVKEESFKEFSVMIKAEDMNFNLKKEPSMETPSSFEELCQPENLTEAFQEPDLSSENHGKRKYFKIIRKSCFKPQNDAEITQKSLKKTHKISTPKRPPSNAKHLWINYSRKILEFALENTRGDVNTRAGVLVGKIHSRKEFKDMFKVKSQDTLNDKAFKAILGQMALYFIHFKADTAFEDTKYKPKMISQKNKVLTLVTKVMNESFPQNNLYNNKMSKLKETILSEDI